MMREIIVIGSYHDTPEKELMLQEMIGAIPRTTDIALSTHFPTPTYIQARLCYLIYDSCDPVVDVDVPVWYGSEFVQLTYVCSNKYYGLAGQSAVYNAFQLLKNYYDIIHFIDADNTPKIIEPYLKKLHQHLAYPWKGAGSPWYPNPHPDTAPAGLRGMWSVNTRRFKEMPRFDTLDQMRDFIGTGDYYGEALLHKMFEPDIIYIDVPNMNRVSTTPGVHSFFCDVDENTVILFHINPVDLQHKQVSFTIDERKVEFLLRPNIVVWHTMPRTSLFNGQPIVTRKDNRFKFPNGWKSPYWDETDDKRVGNV